MNGDLKLGAEITHISSHGVWLLSSGREHFMSYEDFPWFKNAPSVKIFNAEEVSTGHFYCPDLDVDLELESIVNPERFPLRCK